jgi:hypothetical protein
MENSREGTVLGYAQGDKDIGSSGDTRLSRPNFRCGRIRCHAVWLLPSSGSFVR